MKISAHPNFTKNIVLSLVFCTMISTTSHTTDQGKFASVLTWVKENQHTFIISGGISLLGILVNYFLTNYWSKNDKEVSSLRPDKLLPDMKTLQDTFDKLTNQCKEESEQLKTLENRINEINTLQNTDHDKIVILEATCTTVTEQIRNFNNEMDKLNKDIEKKIQTNFNSFTASITNFNKTLQKYEEIKKSFDALEKKNGEQNEKNKKKLEEQFETLKNDLLKLINTQTTELRENILEQSDVITSLQTKLDNTMKQIIATNKTKWEELYNNYQTVADTTKNKVEKYIQKIIESESHNKKQLTQIKNNCTTQLAKLQKQHTEKINEIYKTHNEELKKQHEYIEHKIKEIEDQYNIQKNNNNKQLDEIQIQYKQLQEEQQKTLDRITQASKEQEKEINQQKQQLQKDIQQLENKLSNLIQENLNTNTTAINKQLTKTLEQHMTQYKELVDAERELAHKTTQKMEQILTHQKEETTKFENKIQEITTAAATDANEYKKKIEEINEAHLNNTKQIINTYTQFMEATKTEAVKAENAKNAYLNGKAGMIEKLIQAIDTCKQNIKENNTDSEYKNLKLVTDVEGLLLAVAGINKDDTNELNLDYLINCTDSRNNNLKIALQQLQTEINNESELRKKDPKREHNKLLTDKKEKITTFTNWLKDETNIAALAEQYFDDNTSPDINSIREKFKSTIHDDAKDEDNWNIIFSLHEKEMSRCIGAIEIQIKSYQEDPQKLPSFKTHAPTHRLYFEFLNEFIKKIANNTLSKEENTLYESLVDIHDPSDFIYATYNRLNNINESSDIQSIQKYMNNKEKSTIQHALTVIKEEHKKRQNDKKRAYPHIKTQYTTELDNFKKKIDEIVTALKNTDLKLVAKNFEKYEDLSNENDSQKVWEKIFDLNSDPQYLSEFEYFIKTDIQKLQKALQSEQGKRNNDSTRTSEYQNIVDDVTRLNSIIETFLSELNDIEKITKESNERITEVLSLNTREDMVAYFINKHTLTNLNNYINLVYQNKITPCSKALYNKLYTKINEEKNHRKMDPSREYKWFKNIDSTTFNTIELYAETYAKIYGNGNSSTALTDNPLEKLYRTINNLLEDKTIKGDAADTIMCNLLLENCNINPQEQERLTNNPSALHALLKTTIQKIIKATKEEITLRNNSPERNPLYNTFKEQITSLFNLLKIINQDIQQMNINKLHNKPSNSDDTNTKLWSIENKIDKNTDMVGFITIAYSSLLSDLNITHDDINQIISVLSKKQNTELNQYFTNIKQEIISRKDTLEKYLTTEETGFANQVWKKIDSWTQYIETGMQKNELQRTNFYSNMDQYLEINITNAIVASLNQKNFDTAFNTILEKFFTPLNENINREKLTKCTEKKYTIHLGNLLNQINTYNTLKERERERVDREKRFDSNLKNYSEYAKNSLDANISLGGDEIRTTMKKFKEDCSNEISKNQKILSEDNTKLAEKLRELTSNIRDLQNSMMCFTQANVLDMEDVIKNAQSNLYYVIDYYSKTADEQVGTIQFPDYPYPNPFAKVNEKNIQNMIENVTENNIAPITLPIFHNKYMPIWEIIAKLSNNTINDTDVQTFSEAVLSAMVSNIYLLNKTKSWESIITTIVSNNNENRLANKILEFLNNDHKYKILINRINDSKPHGWKKIIKSLFYEIIDPENKFKDMKEKILILNQKKSELPAGTSQWIEHNKQLETTEKELENFLIPAKASLFEINNVNKLCIRMQDNCRWLQNKVSNKDKYSDHQSIFAIFKEIFSNSNSKCYINYDNSKFLSLHIQPRIQFVHETYSTKLKDIITSMTSVTNENYVIIDYAFNVSLGEKLNSDIINGHSIKEIVQTNEHDTNLLYLLCYQNVNNNEKAYSGIMSINLCNIHPVSKLSIDVKRYIFLKLLTSKVKSTKKINDIDYNILQICILNKPSDDDIDAHINNIFETIDQFNNIQNDIFSKVEIIQSDNNWMDDFENSNKHILPYGHINDRLTIPQKKLSKYIAEQKSIYHRWITDDLLNKYVIEDAKITQYKKNVETIKQYLNNVKARGAYIDDILKDAKKLSDQYKDTIHKTHIKDVVMACIRNNYTLNLNSANGLDIKINAFQDFKITEKLLKIFLGIDTDSLLDELITKNQNKIDLHQKEKTTENESYVIEEKIRNIISSFLANIKNNQQNNEYNTLINQAFMLERALLFINIINHKAKNLNTKRCNELKDENYETDIKKLLSVLQDHLTEENKKKNDDVKHAYNNTLTKYNERAKKIIDENNLDNQKNSSLEFASHLNTGAIVIIQHYLFILVKYKYEDLKKKIEEKNITIEHIRNQYNKENTQYEKLKQCSQQKTKITEFTEPQTLVETDHAPTSEVNQVIQQYENIKNLFNTTDKLGMTKKTEDDRTNHAIIALYAKVLDGLLSDDYEYLWMALLLERMDKDTTWDTIQQNYCLYENKVASSFNGMLCKGITGTGKTTIPLRYINDMVSKIKEACTSDQAKNIQVQIYNFKNSNDNTWSDITSYYNIKEKWSNVIIAMMDECDKYLSTDNTNTKNDKTTDLFEQMATNMHNIPGIIATTNTGKIDKAFERRFQTIQFASHSDQIIKQYVERAYDQLSSHSNNNISLDLKEGEKTTKIKYFLIKYCFETDYTHIENCWLNNFCKELNPDEKSTGSEVNKNNIPDKAPQSIGILQNIIQTVTPQNIFCTLERQFTDCGAKTDFKTFYHNMQQKMIEG
jgi:hypothetical protein